MGHYTRSGADFQGGWVREHLVAEGKSPHMVTAYTRDVGFLGGWFERTNGKASMPAWVTPIDAREYRSSLLMVKMQKPATAKSLQRLTFDVAVLHRTPSV